MDCSPGYRRNSTSCVLCPADCKTCDDQARCTSCDAPALLDAGQCVDRCSEGKLADDSGACQLEELVDTTVETEEIIAAAVIPAVLVVVTVAVYAVCRRIEPKAHNLVIFTVAFGLFDVITDAIFVYALFQDGQVADALRYAALASVALPVLINLIASLTILARLSGKTAESNEWFSHYYPLAALVAFIAAGCLGALHLLSSNVCRWRGFQAVFDERDRHRIKQLELVTLFVEDLPQLVIQALVISSYGITPISVVTLSASAFAVVFNLLQRFFYMLSHQNRQRLQTMSSKSDLKAAYYADVINQIDPASRSRSSAAIEMLPTSTAMLRAMAGTLPEPYEGAADAAAAVIETANDGGFGTEAPVAPDMNDGPGSQALYTWLENRPATLSYRSEW